MAKEQNAQKNKVESQKVVQAQNTAVGEIAAVQMSGLSQGLDSTADLNGQNITDLQGSYGNRFIQQLARSTMPETKTAKPQRVQRAEGEEGTAVSPEISQRIQRQQGGGNPLPNDLRGQMEANFDTDFEDVRVHTNGEASQLSRSLGAAAFTTDNDIFFRDGHYNPGSQDGQKLLAHELTHVVQQRGASGPQRKSMTVNEPDDQYEKEADSVAEQVVGNGNAPAPTASAPEGTGGEGGKTTAVDKTEENPADLIHEAIEDPKAANETAEEKLKTQEQQPQEEQLADEDITEEDKKRKEQEAKQTARDGQREAKDKAKTEGEEEGQKEEEKQKEKLKEGGEQKPPDKKGPKEAKEGQLKIPGAEAFNADKPREMLFNPETAMSDLEEPDMPDQLLPSWDELAEGTIQLSPLEGVQEELTVRQELTGEESNADFSDITNGAAFGISGEAPEAEAPEQEKSGADMANDALKEGALEGFKAGATSFVKDQAIQAATSKIPYADGLISFVQLGTDPKKWAEDNVFAVGNSAVAAWNSFKSIGDETNGWGYIAATLEALIALIDFINSIVGLINTIFTMVLFAAKVIKIFSNFMVALAPVGTPPPIFPFAWTPGVFTPIATFMASVISFLHPINEVLSTIGNILINIKFGLQPLAIFFRYMDMREFKGDPEELEKKQAKLKGNVSGFVTTATTKTANNLKDKAVSGVKQRVEQKRAKKEIEGLETQQRNNRANQTDDPDLNAKVAAKKEKFAEQFGEGYDEYKNRKGVGQIIKKGVADTFGVRTHTDPNTGKVKVGRSFDSAGNDVTGSGTGKKKYFDSDAGVVGALKKTGMNAINPLGLKKTKDPKTGKVSYLKDSALNLKKAYDDGKKEIQAEQAQDTEKYRKLSEKLGGDRDPSTIADPVKRQKFEDAQQKRDASFTKQEENATRKARAEEQKRQDVVDEAGLNVAQTRNQETNLRDEATHAQQKASQKDQEATVAGRRENSSKQAKEAFEKEARDARHIAATENDRQPILGNMVSAADNKVTTERQKKTQADVEVTNQKQKLTQAQEENRKLAIESQQKDSKVTKKDVEASQERLKKAYDEVKKAERKAEEIQQDLTRAEKTKAHWVAEQQRSQLKAQTNEELARRKDALANFHRQEETRQRQLKQTKTNEAEAERQLAGRKTAAANTAKSMADANERAGGALFEARKNKYKQQDWEDNRSKAGKVFDWVTTVDPSGGQRHGPGALGKDIIGWGQGYAEFKGSQKEYAEARTAVDTALTFYGKKEYADAWALVKDQDASKWQSAADDASPLTLYQTEADYKKLANDITKLQTELQRIFAHGNVVGPKNNISLAITAEFDNDTSYRTLKFASTPFVVQVMSADGEELLSHNVTNIPLDGTAEEVDLHSYLTISEGKFYLSLKPNDIRLVLDGRQEDGSGNYFEEVYQPTAQQVENRTDDDGAQHSDITVRYTRQKILQGPTFKTEATLPPATAGEAYTADITADDPDGENSQIVFLSAPNPYPNWLNIRDQGNGTATLTGTPPEGVSGTQRAKIWIFDQDELMHSREFQIEVTAVSTEGEGTAQTKLIQRQASDDGDEEEALEGKSEAELEQEIQTGESLAAELNAPAPAEPAPDSNDPIDLELEAEEQVAEEQEKEEDEDAPTLSELITAARMTQMVDELPEPPENAIDTIQQNAIAFAHLTGEEYDLYLERQQLAQLQEHGRGQQMELEGTQAINQMNKKGVDKQIADAEVQKDTQEEMKQASANQQEQAQESSEQGGLFDSLFSDIFGGIMQGFGLGSAVGVGGSGDASAVNSGSKETSKTTEDTNQVVKNSPAHMDERQSRTAKVSAEAQQSRAELDGLDNLLDQRKAENEEGLDILSDTEQTNLEEQDAVAEEKERLQDEHLETLDEAVMWASDHRMVRENIFSQLEDDLTNDPREQEETLEQISF